MLNIAQMQSQYESSFGEGRMRSVGKGSKSERRERLLGKDCRSRGTNHNLLDKSKQRVTACW